jgi:hypothetical protein
MEVDGKASFYLDAPDQDGTLKEASSRSEAK